jgi:trk system potassium uptake protein TrkH
MNATQRNWLTASQYVCANVVAIVAIYAVDMPGGYLGAGGETTAFGAWYAASLLALSVGLGVSRIYWDWEPSRRVMELSLGANLGVFVPALVVEPVVAVLCVGWHLFVFTQFFVPLRELTLGGRRSLEASDDKTDSWLSRYGAALRHASVVTSVLTVSVVGYRLTNSWVVIASCFLLNWTTAAFAAGVFWRARNEYPRSLSLLLGLLLLSIGLLAWGPSAALGILVVFQLGVLLFLAAFGDVLPELLEFFSKSPALFVAVSFATAIGLGTILLTFPAASESGRALPLIDALFTATSAICVTGLTVVGTPDTFTFFGEAVILGLIQIGGLGIIVLSTFAVLILGSQLGLRGEQALEPVLVGRGSRPAYRLILFIVLSTFAIEFVGAILLGISFYPLSGSVGGAAWKAVFHAVSAFCNAGFALQPESLAGLKGDPFALSVFGTLIVAGGIGFVVIAGLWRWVRGEQRHLSVHTKLVALTTVGLIAGGAFVIALVEWNGGLGGMPFIDKVGNAIFHSVTLRTAGFSSIETSQFSGATILLFMILMFIGGAPGSAAGGVKTTTLALLMGGIRAIWSGYSRVVVFGRRISQQLVYRSASVVIVLSAATIGGLFVLLLTQSQPFVVLLFESVSAIGTVGLSLGATPELDMIGKMVVSLMMFIGRVGPLTVALVLVGDERPSVDYPEVEVMIG